MLGGSLCWATVPMVRKSAVQRFIPRAIIYSMPARDACKRIVLPLLSLGVLEAVALDLSQHLRTAESGLSGSVPECKLHTLACNTRVSNTPACEERRAFCLAGCKCCTCWMLWVVGAGRRPCPGRKHLMHLGSSASVPASWAVLAGRSHLLQETRGLF